MAFMKCSLHSLLFLLIFGASVNIFAFPLDSVLSRGDSSINVSWVPDSQNTRSEWYVRCGAQCTGSDTVCRHNDFIPGVTYRGVAYSFGGNDNYSAFRTRLKLGKLVGSHLCHYNSCQSQILDSICGNDCSSFVCYCWDEPRQATSGLLSNAKYTHITISQLRSGDILVTSGHTVLVVDRDDDTHFLIYESEGTPANGCHQQLIDITTSPWSNYTPLRNQAIVSSEINQFAMPSAGKGQPQLFGSDGHFRAAHAENLRSVQIYSFRGEILCSLVNKSSVKNSDNVRLNPGIYVIRIVDDSGQIFSEKCSIAR